MRVRHVKLFKVGLVVLWFGSLWYVRRPCDKHASSRLHELEDHEAQLSNVAFHSPLDGGNSHHEYVTLPNADITQYHEVQLSKLAPHSLLEEGNNRQEGFNLPNPDLTQNHEAHFSKIASHSALGGGNNHEEGLNLPNTDSTLDNNAASCDEKMQRRYFYSWDRKTIFPNYLKTFQTLYQPYNFELQSSCVTHPWLGLSHRGQYEREYCRKVFTDWFESNKLNVSGPPPRKIPPELITQYSMGGIADIAYFYHGEDNQKSKKTKGWSTQRINKVIQLAIARDNFTYGIDTQAIYEALKTISLQGKDTAVIGSLSPWLEGILLSRHARKVKTIEYGKIISRDPRVSTALPIEVAQDFLTEKAKLFDFIATFSSLEHSGLGRYGDVPDPFGDVKEVEKCWCLLKPGGIMLIGLPAGYDKVIWNGNRVYGPYRLPMMTAGFEVINVFDGPTGLMDWKRLKNDEWIFSNVPMPIIHNVVMLKKLDRN